MSDITSLTPFQICIEGSFPYLVFTVIEGGGGYVILLWGIIMGNTQNEIMYQSCRKYKTHYCNLSREILIIFGNIAFPVILHTDFIPSFISLLFRYFLPQTSTNSYWASKCVCFRFPINSLLTAFVRVHANFNASAKMHCVCCPDRIRVTG